MRFISIKMVFFVVLFIATTAGAVGVEAPSSVPENVSWGFKVRLDPTERWSTATVRIDGNSLLHVYPNGTILSDPYNGQFVLKAFLVDEDTFSTSGYVLYVSHIGLPKGIHVVSTSSESGSDSANIISFAALDESYKKVTQQKFSEVESTLEENKADTNSVLKRQLADSNRVSALEQKARFFESKFDSLTEQLSGAQSLAGQLYELQQKASKEEEKKKTTQSPTAAFLSLAGDAVTPIVYLGGIIIIAVVFLFVARFVRQKMAENSIYSRKDEYDLPVSSEQRKNQSGKWKFEP